MIEMKLTGLDEVMDNIGKLPLRVQRNVVVGSIRAAAKPIQQRAKSTAPVGNDELGGVLQSAIISKVKFNKKNGRVYAFIGPDSNVRVGPKRPVRYAHAVEWGHAASGWNAGGPRVPGKKWMTKVFMEMGSSTVHTVVAEIRKRFERAMTKHGGEN